MRALLWRQYVAGDGEPLLIAQRILKGFHNITMPTAAEIKEQKLGLGNGFQTKNGSSAGRVKGLLLSLCARLVYLYQASMISFIPF